ncbi:putative chaperonin-like RbcX [Rosa chinensis]|uniref:Putative chaperonin-like RbcX n=1 Tax=Rosa chinensis TaxID=74649 RepID=A0A2P6Q2G8_ROSCH|nr:putative chaperonin-like RbcX [Rosa chinensis]
MESSAALVPFSQLPSFFSQNPNNRISKAHPSWPSKPRTSLPTRIHCQKMYVPGFGEASPEAKAANNLHSFFTYVAVSIVTAQLESYNREAYEELMEFLSRNSLNDGDKFCADLMRESSRHQALGMLMSQISQPYRKFYHTDQCGIHTGFWWFFSIVFHCKLNLYDTLISRLYFRHTQQAKLKIKRLLI